MGASRAFLDGVICSRWILYLPMGIQLDLSIVKFGAIAALCNKCTPAILLPLTFTDYFLSFSIMKGCGDLSRSES